MHLQNLQNMFLKSNFVYIKIKINASFFELISINVNIVNYE